MASIKQEEEEEEKEEKEEKIPSKTEETPVTSEEIPFKGEDISPDKDGCLLKQIVRQGPNEERPMFDDKVFIHYIGTELNGKIFINSRDRGEKYSFSLGRGDVIKAWDMGVATMKHGEIARFMSKPKFAYGLKGLEGKVGSATTVIFEIELFGSVGKDLSEERDESIVRRIIRRGEGCEPPNEHGTAEVSLKGTYDGAIFDERTVQFIIGQGFQENVPLGIERAVTRMMKNELCQLDLKLKALQGLEKFSIPSDASVRYEVTLIKFERFKEERLLNDEQKLEQTDMLKQRADELVKSGHYELAVKRYKIVTNILLSASYQTDKDLAKSRKLKFGAQSNLALCYLKLGDYPQCKRACEGGLAFDAKNEKCIFRRGQAQLALFNFDQAMEDFQTILKINPSNLAAKQQIEQCHQQKKLYLNEQKGLYQSFFKKPSKTNTKENNRSAQLN